MMGLPDDPLANLRLPPAALTPDPVFPLILKAKLQKGGKFSWHFPVLGPRARPLAVAPAVEVVEEEIARFLLSHLAQS